jgi:5-(carboxyamino)imidazole ribonucleotide mutase
VATFAIGPAGAANAALFAVAMMGVNNLDMRLELEAFRRDQTEIARNMVLPITGSAK